MAQGTSGGASSLTYLYQDHLGSTVATTGASTSTTSYWPFGGVRSSSGTLATDKRFTGQRLDSLVGLYDFGARSYNPETGHFVQPDTIVPRADDPQSFNRYSYTRNNPLKYVDPTGHAEQCEDEDSCGDWSSGGDNLTRGTCDAQTPSTDTHLCDSCSDIVTPELPTGCDYCSAVVEEDGPPRNANDDEDPDKGKNGSTLQAPSVQSGGSAGGSSGQGNNSGLPTGAFGNSNNLGGLGTTRDGVTVVPIEKHEDYKFVPVNRDNNGPPASAPVGRSGGPIRIAPGTNEPTSINDRDYSGHALDQMQGRGIPPSAVDTAVTNGTAYPGKYPNTTIYYDLDNNVSVVVISETGQVITVLQGKAKGR